MIAQRFRPIGWVLGVALAVMFLYGIQLQVANERGKLQDVEQRISIVSKDIRRLNTEFKTRASMRQLERWNVGETGLALSTPSARQYLASEGSISDLGSDRFAGVGAPPPPPMLLSEVSGVRPADSDSAHPPSGEPQLTETDRMVQKAIKGEDEPQGVKLASLKPKPVVSNAASDKVTRP